MEEMRKCSRLLDIVVSSMLIIVGLTEDDSDLKQGAPKRFESE